MLIIKFTLWLIVIPQKHKSDQRRKRFSEDVQMRIIPKMSSSADAVEFLEPETEYVKTITVHLHQHNIC